MDIRATLKDFEEAEQTVFHDGDIVLVNKIEDIPQVCVNVDFFVVCFCKQGCMQLLLNGKNVNLKGHQMMIALPNSTYENILVSPDFKGGAFSFSNRIVREMFIFNSLMRDIAIQIKMQPIYNMNDIDEKLGDCLSSLFTLIMENRDNVFFEQSMQAAFKLTLYQIFNQIASESKYNNDATIISRGEILFHDFMRLLEENHGFERQVNYYADVLCVSPKYLSAVCKETTGRTASTWINEIAIEYIKKKLLYSSDSVKEISNEMNFPNLSFFGRYVKKHLGYSPLAYRKNVSPGDSSIS